jgi:LmbE family N-acetylglucosaminyl deacetylase
MPMKKVLVIVAHPDDETIWMGGTLLKNKNNWETTIISLCRRDDADRAPKFKKSCNEYHAKSHISDLEDETMEDLDQEEVEKRIEKFTKNSEYDYIFTHGKNGEYGHKRHLDVYKAVNKMIKEKKLFAKKVFYFSYNKKGEFAYPNKESDKLIYLNEATHKEKKRLIQEIYGFPKGGFEEVCCRKIEAFKIKK